MICKRRWIAIRVKWVVKEEEMRGAVRNVGAGGRCELASTVEIAGYGGHARNNVACRWNRGPGSRLYRLSLCGLGSEQRPRWVLCMSTSHTSVIQLHWDALKLIVLCMSGEDKTSSQAARCHIEAG
jgi:hypothetical protein